MNLLQDTGSLMILFIHPALFGLTLIGEGVNKIMNYDGHGWISISIGSIFEIIILVTYFMMSARTFN